MLHVFAALLLFTSLGAVAAAGSPTAGGFRRLAGIAHGVALAIIFVAGFGLMARLGLFGEIPFWAWAKIGVWLVLGVVALPLRRNPGWATKPWAAIPVVGRLAVRLAAQKPS